MELYPISNVIPISPAVGITRCIASHRVECWFVVDQLRMYLLGLIVQFVISLILLT